MKTCPKCKSENIKKVIYAGFPFYLCDHGNKGIPLVFGFWSWIIRVLPFNGVFFVYTGGYLGALWYWITDQ